MNVWEIQDNETVRWLTHKDHPHTAFCYKLPLHTWFTCSVGVCRLQKKLSEFKPWFKKLAWTYLEQVDNHLFCNLFFLLWYQFIFKMFDLRYCSTEYVANLYMYGRILVIHVDCLCTTSTECSLPMHSSSFHTVKVHCHERGIIGVWTAYKRDNLSVSLLLLNGLQSVLVVRREVFFSVVILPVIKIIKWVCPTTASKNILEQPPPREASRQFNNFKTHLSIKYLMRD